MQVDKLTTTFREKSFAIVVVVGLGMVLPRTPVKLIIDGAICVSTDTDASNNTLWVFCILLTKRSRCKRKGNTFTHARARTVQKTWRIVTHLHSLLVLCPTEPWCSESSKHCSLVFSHSSSKDMAPLCQVLSQAFCCYGECLGESESGPYFADRLFEDTTSAGRDAVEQVVQ